MHVRTYVCMYVYTYVCMHVHMYVYIFNMSEIISAENTVGCMHVEVYTRKCCGLCTCVHACVCTVYTQGD